MFNNFFSTGFKVILKSKLYAAINILGLATGLAACLLISVLVRYELGYDSSFADAGQIYRLSADFGSSSLGPESHWAGNVAPLVPLLKQTGLDGVAAMARIGGMRALLGREDLAFYEDRLRWADQEIFDIFQLRWLQGTAEQALALPDSVVLTQTLARKYFSGEDPMGQTLLLENTWPLTVTGVIEDLPANSHLSADLIIPMETAWKLLDFDYSNNWYFPNFHTYLKLEPGADIDGIMRQINDTMASLDSELISFWALAPETFSFTPFRLQDIHFSSGRRGEFTTPGNVTFVLAFSAIALGLLLIACINFTNLSTARAALRAREVGLRKTIGASRGELIRQFLGESFLTTIVALVLALMLTELLLPVFGTLMERQLSFGTVSEPAFLLFIAGVAVFTGFAAGTYPALYLSGFRPVKVMGSHKVSAGSGLTLRNVLVVTQFCLAISLLVCTAVVYLQLQYARRLELGFNKEEIVALTGTSQAGLGTQWEAFKNQLLQHPDIFSVTEGDMTPNSAASRHVRIEGGLSSGFDILSKRVGMDFFSTYDIAVLAGRDFDATRSSDIFQPPGSAAPGQQLSGSYVINATAVRELGLEPDEVLGRTLEVDFSTDFSLTVSGPVIGVVEDVHLFSLREPIRPLLYYVPTQYWGGQPSFNVASIRISGNNTQASLALIREQWQRFMPELPFIYRFLDADYQALYRNEERQGQIFTLFALLTIAIACLGLYGLAAFTVERRRKEIGVRKVVGSSVLSIVLLLTNDFSKLVLLANVLAWPLAYMAMERWLENFAYRIDLTPLIFIGSGLVALCVAWVTVGGTAAKAASQKPVLALRYE